MKILEAGTGIEPVFTDLQSNRLHSENSALDRKKYQDKPGTPREPDTPALPSNAAAANENPGALGGATEADLHGSRVADEDSLKRIEAARALAAAVSDCDPRDRIPLLKRLLDYHLGIGRGFFFGPEDWS